MQSNNPFEVHDINYLSPSSMNTYISDMPMWVARYLFGVKSGGGAGAVNITSAGTGNTVKMMDRRYVEYMDKFYDSSETDADAAHFLDCGAIYSGGSTSTISG